MEEIRVHSGQEASVPSGDAEDPVILVCQGSPACDYDGSGDTEAYMGACVWCARITCHADGTETVQEPSQC